MSITHENPLAGRTLRAAGMELDPEHVGLLESSSEYLNDPEALRQRKEELGYLYLPGFFDRDAVLEVRMHLLEQLNERGMVKQGVPLEQGVYDPTNDPLAPGQSMMVDLDQSKVEGLIYGQRAQSFFDSYFGEAAKHFDFTWLRVVRPGGLVDSTPPHCDIVYMGRGTFQVHTMWVPYGNVPVEEGGLMVLEDSHKKNEQIRSYLERDVDSYCSNSDEADKYASGEKSWSGALSNNPVNLRKKLGGRWLVADYKMGDVLIFGMGLVHAGLDGQGDRIRLSSDCRYQAGSEAIDPRWVGSNVKIGDPKHRIGRIC